MKELVVVKENQVVTTSLQVAETFNKQHKAVLEAIDAKIQSAENSAHYQNMFAEGDYKDSRGRKQRLYYMNRDGLSFIAFGFTGRKADAFKLKYIEAFNRMERQLREGFHSTFSLDHMWNETISSLKAEITAEVLAEIRNDMATAVEMEATLQCEKELQQYKVLTSAKLAEFLGFSEYGRKGAAQLNKALAEAGVLTKQQESNGRKSWKVAEHWVEFGLAVESVYVGHGNWVRWTQKGAQKIKEMAELGLITIV